MPQQYGWMANQAVKHEFRCQVCGKSTGFNWSDLHGEAMCNTCGTPYQIIQYNEDKTRKDAPPRLNLKDEWVSVAQEYWNETHTYMGLGTIMIARDYPECIAGKEKFYDWVEQNHSELLKPKER